MSLEENIRGLQLNYRPLIHFLGKQKLNHVINTRRLPRVYGEFGFGVYATYDTNPENAGTKSGEELSYALLFHPDAAESCFRRIPVEDGMGSNWAISKEGASIVRKIERLKQNYRNS